MATQVIGSVALNPFLPIQSRAAGSVNFGPVDVPAGYSILYVLFDLQQVADLTAVFSASFQLALDGVTFQAAGAVALDLSVAGFVVTGGVLTRPASDPLGPGPLRVSGGQVLMKGTHLTTRKIQGTFTCNNPSTSGITLVAF